MLKPDFTTETVHRIEYDEFERIIKEAYPEQPEFEFVADQECGNDSSLSFSNVDGKDIGKDEEEELEEFILGSSYSFITNVLLEDLVRRKVIPAGNWLIDVCW